MVDNWIRPSGDDQGIQYSQNNNYCVNPESRILIKVQGTEGVTAEAVNFGEEARSTQLGTSTKIYLRTSLNSFYCTLLYMYLYFFYFRSSRGTGLGYDIEAYYVSTADGVQGVENTDD